MKTPEDKNNNLPAELDKELQDLSSEDVQGLEEVWNLAAMPVTNGFPDAAKLDAIWNAVDEKTALGTPLPSTPRKGDRSAMSRTRSPRLFKAQWLAVAAVVIIGVLGVRTWFSPLTITVPYGETLSVKLPDGTDVELNSGSRLLYARSFGDERNVKLEGEAFFDVVKENRPFIVETFNSSVHVLGTSFNVKAWDEEAKTIVALQSGSVQVTGVNTDDAMELSPGQVAQVEEEHIFMHADEDGLLSSSIAWRKGGFAYSEEDLGAIIRDIERRFDTNIALNPSSISKRKTKYNRQSPGSARVVLEEISASLGLAYRVTSTGFELYAPEE